MHCYLWRALRTEVSLSVTRPRTLRESNDPTAFGPRESRARGDLSAKATATSTLLPTPPWIALLMAHA